MLEFRALQKFEKKTLLIARLAKTKPFRPFGRGITPFRGPTNHGYEPPTKWDDPPSRFVGSPTFVSQALSNLGDLHFKSFNASWGVETDAAGPWERNSGINWFTLPETNIAMEYAHF